MKNLNNIVFGRLLHTVVCCGAALLLMALTACEGSELYRVNAPDWLSAKVDSIKNANNGGEEEEEVLEGQMEDVYNIGNENLTSGFWTLGKTYVVPAGEKWQAQFNLTVNPDNKYFKNFYIVLNACTNAETGDLGDEYGVIRYDNDPSKNSEWNTTGTEINRSLVDGNFFSVSGDDDVDANAQKMNGKIRKINNVILNAADITQFPGCFLVFKPWPEKSRCIKQFKVWRNFNPLIASCYARFVSDLCDTSSAEPVDQRAFPYVRNSDNHCPDCFTDTFLQRFFYYFLCCFVNQADGFLPAHLRCVRQVRINPLIPEAADPCLVCRRVSKI